MMTPTIEMAFGFGMIVLGLVFLYYTREDRR